VEIMIVVAIIASSRRFAVPGFLRARKRSQASKFSTTSYDSGSIDQYAIENLKKSEDQVLVADWN